MRTDDRIDLFRKPVEVVDVPPALPDGGRPRGLTEGGWVRTTGWLQVGDHPVSSAHVAALAGLLWAVAGAAVLVRDFPVTAGILVLTAPVVCGVVWWLVTTLLRPASTARNVATKPADELSPGDVVRLYGSIGPIGLVTAVTVGDDIRVACHGGVNRSFARRQPVYIAELRN